MTGRRSDRIDTESTGPHGLQPVLVRMLLYALAMAMVLFGFQSVTGKFYPLNVTGFLVASCSIMLGQWGAIRLWKFSIYPLLESRTRGRLFIGQVPFSCMGGGMGCTLGLLISKQLGIIEFAEQPVDRMFYAGAILGCLLQGVQVLIDRGPAEAKNMDTHKPAMTAEKEFKT